MKNETCWWSCHIPKEKLRELGARAIFPAKHSHPYPLAPEADKEGMELIFQADEGFETIVKFACDRDIVEVPWKHHRAISKGRFPKIGLGSKLSQALSSVKYRWYPDADK